MTSQSTVSRVTFKHPFQLPGMTEPHQPGSFELWVDKIALDVSWEAHRTSCRLILVDGAITSALLVTMSDLEAALRSDHQHDVNTGFS